MIDRSVVIVAALGLGLSYSAYACSILPPKNEELVRRVAHEGVVIRGTIVQPLDEQKDQPEIIEADEVYVGDRGLKRFVIYHHPRAYELLRDPSSRQTSCDWAPNKEPLGTTRIFVLMPLKFADPVSNGRWNYETFGQMVMSDKVLPELVASAREAGRLQSVPERNVNQ